MKTDSDKKIIIKPLALRYLFRIYKELGEEKLKQIVEISKEIAIQEKHYEIRANTVRKAVSRLTNKSLDEVKKKFFPLKIPKSEIKDFTNKIYNLINKK